MEEGTSQLDRLREHAKSFDGLLSLIPAKVYYGEDTTDQWKRKKQTKEQAVAAKRAKLDPDSIKSAKDVMDEQARKRKLSEMDDSDLEGIEREKPKEGLKAAGKDKKKRKIDETQATKPSNSESITKGEIEDDTSNSAKILKAEQRKIKQQRKKDKIAKKLEKQKVKKQGALEQKVEVGGDETEIKLDGIGDHLGEEGGTVPACEGSISEKELEILDLDGMQEEDLKDQQSPASRSSEPPSPVFDNTTGQSANTSTSSVVPPATAPKHIKLPTDPELLKARLAARIEALRAARKADGPNGAPARNRQELMEARRKKEEQRRAHKKELRLKAKAEDEARREEALISARGSPASSMLSPAIHNSSENNFSFNRVSFSDGQTLSTDLSSLHGAPKSKGPRDPATALLASENKRLRLAGLDDAKRADIEQKDLWLSAKKRAHGEKVHDDTSLLKKTLKRKEKAKKKSEKEWAERKEGVAKGQAIRQKKREENLRKRREDRGTKSKGGKGGKPGASKGKPKVRSRPGFEGSFSSAGKRR